MSRRLVVLLAIAALLVSACSGDGEPEVAPPPTADPTEESTPEATPEPTPTPTPTPESTVAPLTGVEVDDPSELDRPVFAVKIDNHPAALPQDGLEDADIVLSELVEGGAIRFIALFHSRDPGEVGPIRSARDVDMELLPAFNPVFAYSGANEGTLADLVRSDLLLVTEDEPGWFRRSRPGVPREHTLYAAAAEQWERGADLPAAEEPWPFSEATDGGTPVTGMSLTYSDETTVSWEWDGERFVREQYGAPHETASGDRVAAVNVVVPRVEVHPSPRGSGLVTIDVVGEGEATVFRDGRAIEARWRKTAPEDQFAWLTPDGDPLPLAPGGTWIELVPTRGSVDIRPEDDETDDASTPAPAPDDEAGD